MVDKNSLVYLSVRNVGWTAQLLRTAFLSIIGHIALNTCVRQRNNINFNPIFIKKNIYIFKNLCIYISVLQNHIARFFIANKISSNLVITESEIQQLLNCRKKISHDYSVVFPHRAFGILKRTFAGIIAKYRETDFITMRSQFSASRGVHHPNLRILSECIAIISSFREKMRGQFLSTR